MVKKEANLVPLRRVCALVQLMEKSPETRIADTSGEIQKMRLQIYYHLKNVKHMLKKITKNHMKIIHMVFKIF